MDSPNAPEPTISIDEGGVYAGVGAVMLRRVMCRDGNCSYSSSGLFGGVYTTAVASTKLQNVQDEVDIAVSTSGAEAIG